MYGRMYGGITADQLPVLASVRRKAFCSVRISFPHNYPHSYPRPHSNNPTPPPPHTPTPTLQPPHPLHHTTPATRHTNLFDIPRTQPNMSAENLEGAVCGGAKGRSVEVGGVALAKEVADALEHRADYRLRFEQRPLDVDDQGPIVRGCCGVEWGEGRVGRRCRMSGVGCRVSGVGCRVSCVGCRV
jgi:hypothetical protein